MVILTCGLDRHGDVGQNKVGNHADKYTRKVHCGKDNQVALELSFLFEQNDKGKSARRYQATNQATQSYQAVGVHTRQDYTCRAIWYKANNACDKWTEDAKL